MGTFRSLHRAALKANGEFKGKSRLRGHRNHINRDRSVRNQKSSTGSFSLLAVYFSQLFGNALRSVNKQSVKSA